MKSIKGLSFYNSEGSLIDVEELYAQVQQLKQDSAAKIIIGETASTTSTTSSDIDELAGTETDISLTNADDFKAGDMGISIVTVTDRNNSHGFMVFSALADEPDQPAGTLHVRFITGIYNGKDGTDGVAATIEVGTVTTGAAGSQASVTNSGTENAAVLDITIPRGADGASGVTDVTAGTPTEQDGYTVTPVTFNFEQGNSKIVNIQAKNGEGAGVQQNAVINRTVSVDTADENSPDFVQNNGDLWVKKVTGYEAEVTRVGTSLPSARESTSAATAPNGKIYVFGGCSRTDLGHIDSHFDDIVEFDPVTQSVTTLDATLPSARYDTSAATAPNGKIYVFGGYDDSTYLDDIVEFDPVAQTATKLSVTLPNGRNDTSAATAPNGKIYVFGGYSDRGSGRGDLDDIVEFDPVAQTATKLSVTLPSTRISTSAATAPNGKIYVFGGRRGNNSDDGTSESIVEFDPVTQSVTTLEATLPSRKYDASAATAPNGKIYVFGGKAAEGSFFSDTIAEFDPVTQTVTALEATLPSGRCDTSAATAPNGKIYVFGGAFNISYTATVDASAAITEFDPVTQTVTALEVFLPTYGRNDTSAATAPNGKIYVFGGYSDRAGGRGYLDEIVEFDPVAQTATKLSVKLPSDRENTSAVTAPNGKIYVFGGFDNRGTGNAVFLDDIVEFDPVAQTATKLSVTLPSGRHSTSAATAPNGKIYVFGGLSRGSVYYSNDIVEFDPVTQSVTTLDATLPSARYDTSAATAPNGKIYVFGGYDDSTYLDKIVEFDPVTQVVTTLKATLPTARSNTSAATAPNGKVYVFGGLIRVLNGTESSNEIAEFDPVAQTAMTLEATLPSGRCDTSAATALNGKIYVFGGYGGGGYGPYYADIVECDPVAQYIYSPTVVLSQEEYAQFKNILKGVFSVGISVPNAEISGTLEAGNTRVNGTLTAAGKITAPSATINGNLTADSAEVSGTLSAGNTTVNGTLSADSAKVSGAVTANSAEISGALNANSAEINGTLNADSAEVSGTVTASNFNATT